MAFPGCRWYTWTNPLQTPKYWMKVSEKGSEIKNNNVGDEIQKGIYEISENSKDAQEEVEKCSDEDRCDVELDSNYRPALSERSIASCASFTVDCDEEQSNKIACTVAKQKARPGTAPASRGKGRGSSDTQVRMRISRSMSACSGNHGTYGHSASQNQPHSVHPTKHSRVNHATRRPHTAPTSKVSSSRPSTRNSRVISKRTYRLSQKEMFPSHTYIRCKSASILTSKAEDKSSESRALMDSTPTPKSPKEDSTVGNQGTSFSVSSTASCRPWSIDTTPRRTMSEGPATPVLNTRSPPASPNARYVQRTESATPNFRPHSASSRYSSASLTSRSSGKMKTKGRLYTGLSSSSLTALSDTQDMAIIGQAMTASRKPKQDTQHKAVADNVSPVSDNPKMTRNIVIGGDIDFNNGRLDSIDAQLFLPLGLSFENVEYKSEMTYSGSENVQNTEQYKALDTNLNISQLTLNDGHSHTEVDVECG